MSITQIHGSIATTVVLFNLILGGWGLIKFLRRQGMDSNFWGALWLSPVLGLIQLAIGVILVLTGHGVGVRGVHYLYGSLVVIGMPATFAFTRGRDDRAAVLIYGVVLILVSVFGVRAEMTVRGLGF